MTRNRNEEEPDALREDLLRSGIDAEGNPAALVQALRERIGSCPERDRAIASLLGEVASSEAAAALVLLEEKAGQRGDKLTAKAARRSLYRLSQRGVPAPPRQAPAGTPIHRGLGPELGGLLSQVDGAGGRLAWITRPQVGGVLLFSAAINEPLGMEDVSLVDTTRKQLRSFRRDLQEKHGLRLVEADWHYVDALCQQAFQRARERRSEGISQFPALRQRLTHEPPAVLGKALAHRLLDTAALAENGAALARSRALFDEPELSGWLLPPAVRDAYGKELREVMDSPLVLSPRHKEERAEEVIGKCTHEAFSKSLASTYVRRLEETSYYFLQTDRKAQAEAAMAAALALASSGAGGVGIPFCEQLVRRTLGLLLLEGERREREEAASSVLIRPGVSDPPGEPPPAPPAGRILKP